MTAAPSLLELQQGFADAVFGRSEAAERWVIGAGLTPAARLQIYCNTVANTQSDALRASYPALLALVGENFFITAAARYRLQHPSTQGNLQAFGDRFGEFLAAMPEASSLPYLADVACLEWLRQEAALAAESPPLDALALSRAIAGDPARLWLGLHPSVRLLGSRHEVLTIWRYSQALGPDGLQLSARGESVVIWRVGPEVGMAALDPASFALVRALAEGQDLASANRMAVAVDGEFNLADCLRSLIAQELIATFRIEE